MDNGKWEFVSPARPVVNKKKCSATVFADMKPGMREYMMFFPLYDGVDSLYIGVDSAAVIEMPKVDLPKREKPVVIYGTSITQGACASKPGSCYQSILSRRYDCDYINLGFAGSARGEETMANYIKSLDMSLFVLDLRFLLNDFLAVVGTARFAYTVSKNVLATLCTLYHSGQFKLPVIRSSLVSASFRDLFLRYCHWFTPP